MFPQPVPDQTEAEVGQVADTTVDQLGRLTGRSAGEVVLLDQSDVQSTAGRVAGPGGAYDTSAYDHQVENPRACHG